MKKNRILLVIFAVLHCYLFLNFSSKLFVLITLFVGLVIEFDLLKKVKFSTSFKNGVNTFVMIVSVAMGVYGIKKMIDRPLNQPEFEKKNAVIFEKSTYETALLKAKQQNKLVFVDFYTTWCGPCVAFKKQILDDNDVAITLNQKFINLTYDCEKGEGVKVASLFKIRYYPTVLIIDSNGKVVQKLVENNVVSKSDFLTEVMKY